MGHFMGRKVQDKLFKERKVPAQSNYLPPRGILSTACQPHGEVEELRQHVYRWIILQHQFLIINSTFQAQFGAIVKIKYTHASIYNGTI
jgi:hypothetical protein